jgi:hypothetical protein
MAQMEHQNQHILDTQWYLFGREQDGETLTEKELILLENCWNADVEDGWARWRQKRDAKRSYLNPISYMFLL